VTKGLLTNKVALVTGSSRGIGAGIAKLFAREGARVAVHGRDDASIAATRREIEQAGGRAIAVAADVTRYAEIEERALVYEGRKHYFMVNFPQEPGALRRFLDSVLGPDDDITLFEYVKRSNRETGPALVGIELGDKADLPGLLQRMAQSRITVEQVPPDSMFYRFLV